jgi:putative membrane protein
VDAEATSEVVTMMGWYGGMGPGAWLFMGGFWIGLLVLVGWLLVRLLPTGDRPTGGESPEDILDRRFARGEIDDETYAAQRSALTAHRGRAR